MLGITDALLLEAMYHNWREQFADIVHPQHTTGFDNWMRRLFVSRLNFLTEGAMA